MARLQARSGSVDGLGPFALALLPLLDGTRDRMALVDEMARRLDPAQRAAAPAAVLAALESLARRALLLA